MYDESFFADERLIQGLVKRSVPVACTESHVLFNQGDEPIGVFVLQRGEAALVMRSPSGQPVMCFQVGPGSLLGLPGVIGKEHYSLTAIVREGSEVMFISREDFEQVLEEEPELYPSVLQVLAAEVRFARRAFMER